MSKILITDRISNPEIERSILGEHLTDIITDEVEVLLVWHKVVDSNYLNNFPNLKLIIRYGVGYDKIDLEECNKRNIIVCNNPDYCTEEVSSTAVAMILNTARNITKYDFEARHYSNGWQENVNKNLLRNSEQNIGFIGVGRIGSITLQQCNSLRFKTSFYDPYINCGYEKVLNSTRVDSLKQLLNSSDIISLHCPLNDSTKNIIDEKFISNMKKGSSLINTARGGLLKNLDIIEDALRSEHLNMVSLDVLPDEPPFEHNLIKAWKNGESWLSGRLIINPHASYYSIQSSNEQRPNVANNALRFINGLKPLNIVNGF
jgi:phosphoglycerate dehydrogenase-like enzyme